MKLARPFFRLPVRFDVARLRSEVEALPADAWAKHPNEIAGNSSLRLISVDGGENDEVYGSMQPTAHLRQCPYIRQILASFNVVWSRSRLMKLDARSEVPDHSDINYHWFYRVRMHIPVITRPEVRFHCDDRVVHMAAGDAWVFDNWRRHHVVNPTDEARIHLVADTSGTASFWEFVAKAGAGGLTDGSLAYTPGVDAELMTESVQAAAVMPPAEVELLVSDFRGELAAQQDSPEIRQRLAAYHWLLQGFCFDWRQVYAVHGEAAAGRGQFEKMRDDLRERSRGVADGLVMRTNRIAAHTVLEGRVLRHLLHDALAVAPTRAARRSAPAELERPLFIVAAPRSGSTLLFETLAASQQLWTLQDEAHWLIEDIPSLRPGPAGVDSNRLVGQDCTEEIAGQITDRLRDRLRDASGRPLPEGARAVRMLEKTPKNALRIPFFRKLFPDARFVMLWRDPRENLSSIMEAWRSGNWVTYRALEGWEGPWSMLLPPGWQSLRGRPLEEIAACQWETANRIMLDDLDDLPAEDWMSVEYARFVADPAAAVGRICSFAGIEFDAGLAARVAGPLPLSRYTQSAPIPDKWRRNEAEILRVLPTVEDTWNRLRSLDNGVSPRS